MGKQITLTVTAKGQVTLKKAVLRHLGVAPGDTVTIDLAPDGGALLRAAPQGSIEAFFGCLPRAERAVSIEEMNQAIAAGWRGKA